MRMGDFNKKNLLIKLFILLFGLSVSMTVIPCGMVNTYGLFGEMQSVTVTETDRAGKEEILSVSKKCHNFKGISVKNKFFTRKFVPAAQSLQVANDMVINIWFEIAAVIIYFIFAFYKFRLPREETIITLKVRLDN